MKREDYYIISETGERVETRPQLLPSSYTAYSFISADPGKVLVNILSGRKAMNLLLVSDFIELWEEQEVNSK